MNRNLSLPFWNTHFLGNKYILDIQIPKKNPTFFAKYTHGFNFSPCTIRNEVTPLDFYKVLNLGMSFRHNFLFRNMPYTRNLST